MNENSITVRAQLIAMGDIAELNLKHGAVFQCVSVEGCRQLGSVLLRECDLTIALADTNDLPEGFPRAVLQIPLLGRKCPECQAEVTVVAITTPVVLNLLVDPDPDHDRVIRQSDGSFAIVPSYKLHALSCPDWPDDQRDWRASMPGYQE